VDEAKLHHAAALVRFGCSTAKAANAAGVGRARQGEVLRRVLRRKSGLESSMEATGWRRTGRQASPYAPLKSKMMIAS
jgi:hypothetical protein